MKAPQEPLSWPVLQQMLWRWLLPDATFRAREASRAQLPIGGLPAGIGDVPAGRIGVVLCDSDATRTRCLRALLEAALVDKPATWVSARPDNPPRLGPVVLAAARRGRLRALAWTDTVTAELQRHGEGHLLRELYAHGTRRRELLVVDAFEPWLAERATPQQTETALQRAVAALRFWSQRRRGAIVALGPLFHGSQALAPLLAHHDLARIAMMRTHGEQLHLEILRWGEPPKAVARDLAFGLVDSADGGWLADGSGLALDARRLLSAHDADAVLTTGDVTRGVAGVPPHWQVFDDHAALVEACRYAVAATVLLPYSGPADVAPLADTVRQLRAAHPHALKIVVRETAAKLRYNHELALLKLGANAVVYREIGFSRLVQTVVELRDQLYGRGGDEDLEITLDTVSPDPVQGYVPATAFCASVENMVERTVNSSLNHCLVRLPLLPHVPHLDALLACRISRNGDVVTADASALLLFLFACREPDVSATLTRMFARPVSELFALVEVHPDAATQRRVLAALRLHSEASAADYSAALNALRPAVGVASVAESTEVADATDKGGVVATAPAAQPEPKAVPTRRVAPFSLSVRKQD